jgi:hypothetical protein
MLSFIVKQQKEFDDSDDAPGKISISYLKQVLGIQNPRYYQIPEKNDQFQEFTEDNKELRNMLIEILENTDDYLYISTALHTDFYNEDQVKENIKRVAEEGTVRILLDSYVDTDRLEDRFPYLFKENNVKLRKSMDRVPHWWISDGEDLRLEKIHAKGERGDKNLVVFDAQPSVYELFEDEYLDWWTTESKEIN